MFSARAGLVGLLGLGSDGLAGSVDRPHRSHGPPDVLGLLLVGGQLSAAGRLGGLWEEAGEAQRVQQAVVLLDVGALAPSSSCCAATAAVGAARPT